MSNKEKAEKTELVVIELKAFWSTSATNAMKIEKLNKLCKEYDLNTWKIYKLITPTY